MWAALFATLPTQPNAVRLRVWRNLKALGCGALRDGVYLLPAAQAALLDEVAAEVNTHGGSATVLALAPRDEVQRGEIEALFDRSAAYAQWQQTALVLQAELPRLAETEARRRLRAVAEALQALQAIDYVPGAAGEQAAAVLSALRQALDACFSNGEPHPVSGAEVPRLALARFQGRRWATRRRPWVDRLASAWLIRRFIDSQATFVWLDDPARAPRGTLGFDFDGAQFTHIGSRVTFEVLMASFGFDGDPALRRIARAVHYLDAGGIPAPEAAGLEAVLAGLREQHADDDVLVAAAAAIFNALYAAPVAAP